MSGLPMAVWIPGESYQGPDPFENGVLSWRLLPKKTRMTPQLLRLLRLQVLIYWNSSILVVWTTKKNLWRVQQMVLSYIHIAVCIRMVSKGSSNPTHQSPAPRCPRKRRLCHYLFSPVGGKPSAFQTKAGFRIGTSWLQRHWPAGFPQILCASVGPFPPRAYSDNEEEGQEGGYLTGKADPAVCFKSPTQRFRPCDLPRTRQDSHVQRM